MEPAAMVAVIATPVYSIDGWSGNVVDDDGVRWVVESEEGWSATPPVRVTTEDRSGDDGAWASQTLRSGRTIVLSGAAVAPNNLAMLRAKDRYAAIAAGRGKYVLTVDEPHVSRQVLVQHSQDAKCADMGPVAFRWQMTFFSADPLRYGTTVVSVPASLPPDDTGGLTFPLVFPLTFGGTTTSGGSVRAMNGGNAETGVVLTIAGPVTNPSVQNATTGELIAFNITLAAGETLTVDTVRHTVLLNGTANRRNLLIPGSTWWRLGPGGTEIRYRAATYSPTSLLTVTFRPAWK